MSCIFLDSIQINTFISFLRGGTYPRQKKNYINGNSFDFFLCFPFLTSLNENDEMTELKKF